MLFIFWQILRKIHNTAVNSWIWVSISLPTISCSTCHTYVNGKLGLLLPHRENPQTVPIKLNENPTPNYSTTAMMQGKQTLIFLHAHTNKTHTGVEMFHYVSVPMYVYAAPHITTLCLIRSTLCHLCTLTFTLACTFTQS
jgi:hypothetical protein